MTEGPRIAFALQVKVDPLEMLRWPPERTAAFLAGIEQVRAAIEGRAVVAAPVVAPTAAPAHDGNGTVPGAFPWPPDRIRRLRKALGLTQEAFAKRIGVSGAAIGNWEYGVNQPGWKHFAALAAAAQEARDAVLKSAAPAPAPRAVVIDEAAKISPAALRSLHDRPPAPQPARAAPRFMPSTPRPEKPKTVPLPRTVASKPAYSAPCACAHPQNEHENAKGRCWRCGHAAKGCQFFRKGVA